MYSIISTLLILHWGTTDEVWNKNSTCVISRCCFHKIVSQQTLFILWVNPDFFRMMFAFGSPADSAFLNFESFVNTKILHYVAK